MKLFSRYNRINIPIMTAVFLLSGICFYFSIKYVLLRELDEDLSERKDKIVSYMHKYSRFPSSELMDEVPVAYSMTSEIVARPQFLLLDRYDPEEGGVRNFREITFTEKLGSQYYRITITKSLEGMHALTFTLVYITASTLLLIVVISLVLNQYVLRNLWAPFYQSLLAIGNFKISKDTNLKLPVTTIDEFAFMNGQLERAIGNVENDYNTLKEFTENASHELQTPLAIIRSKLDLMAQDDNLSAKQSELIKSSFTALKRITRLNQSLLLLAKIENNQFEENTHIKLHEKIEEKVEQFQEFWHNIDIQVYINLQPVMIKANPELIDILLNNLLGNAGRHNKSGGIIIINLEQNCLTISNSGELQPLDTSRLFKRFYKKAHSSENNGLGLSIVKQIVDRSSIEISYAFSNNVHVFQLCWDAFIPKV